MRIRHFYHVYASGAWSEPVREHIDALLASEFAGDITVGLAGAPADRAAARDAITARLGTVTDWTEADAGFEQVTLSALRGWALRCGGEASVLYAHTKGAHDQTEWNAAWRRSMTRRVVGGWRDCVALLGEYETAGCHWLTPGQHHDPPDYVVPSPFYGGNFWWARASYLRTLPPPGTATRHDAELWLGLGNPRAHDLLPGWPAPELCQAAGGDRASRL